MCSTKTVCTAVNVKNLYSFYLSLPNTYDTSQIEKKDFADWSLLAVIFKKTLAVQFRKSSSELSERPQIQFTADCSLGKYQLHR